MKYIFPLITVLFLNSISANNANDSLINSYTKTNSVSQKLDVLYNLSINYKGRKIVAESFVIRELKTLAIQINTDNDLGLFYLIKGNLIFYKDSIYEIKSSYLKAFKLLYRNPKNNYLFHNLNNLGKLYSDIGKKDSAIYYYNLALNNIKVTNKMEQCPSAYFNLGNEYYFISKLEPAIYNFKKSIDYGIKSHDYKSLALSFRILSLIYRDQQTVNYMMYNDSSLYFAKKSNSKECITDALYFKLQCLVLQNKLSKAFEELKEIEKLHKSDTNNIEVYINYCRANGFYYSETKNVEKTLFYYQKKALLNKLINRESGLDGRSYNNIGNVCVESKKFDMAVKYLDTAIYYAQTYNDQLLLWFAYDNIILAHEGLNDYKTANEFYKKLIVLNDSILKKENQSKLAEFETRFNVETKNLSIKNLKSKNELNRVLIQQKNLKQKYLLIGIIFFCVLLVIVLMAYRVKQKANTLLKIQKQDIINKTDLLNKQAEEIAKFRTQMNPHFIFNALNSVQGFVLNQPPTITLDYLNSLSKLMRLTLNNSNNEFIILKDELTFLNLYVDFELHRFNPKFSFAIEVGDEIDEENCLIPPMIIQPFIENAIKHAQLQTIHHAAIKLKITLKTNFLHLIIEDNGCGRKQKTVEEERVHQSMGVAITINRISALHKKQKTGATHYFEITDLYYNNLTTTGSGTKVSIVLPLIEAF